MTMIHEELNEAIYALARAVTHQVMGDPDMIAADLREKIFEGVNELREERDALVDSIGRLADIAGGVEITDGDTICTLDYWALRTLGEAGKARGTTSKKAKE